MYEPKRIPPISEKTFPLPEIRYGIKRGNAFIDLEDPTIDSLHVHGYIEIFFNRAKDVSFLVNDTVYPVAAGELVVCKRNAVHVCIFPRSDVYDYYCLWIDADTALPILSFLEEDGFSPLLTFGEEKSRAIGALFSALEAEKKASGESSLKALSLLLQILSELSAAASAKERAVDLPADLASIIHYIKENFAEIHAVSEVLDRFFISASTLNRGFRRYLRTSPREYIEAQKLAYAMELLKKGKNVTEACTEAGFSDCSHFSVLFKKRFGQTPLQYKKTSPADRPLCLFCSAGI